MLAIRHILFPFDFSERSVGAAPFVESVAARYGASITLFNVVQPMVYAGGAEMGAPLMMDMDTIRAAAQSQLDGSLIKELGTVPVKRVVMVGDPAREIAAFAHDHRVDLIMMPTHGYGAFRRLLLGPVTAKVLHDVECPVWTGAHIEEAPIQSHLACRNVLCAVDRNAAAEPLLRWAADFCRDSGAKLRLVHVAPAIDTWPGRQLDQEFAEHLRTDAREFLNQMQRSAGVEAPLCVTAGDVAGGVRDEARRHNSDLVIIGRGVIHEKLGRLRTHAHSIIRQAPCPVLSV